MHPLLQKLTGGDKRSIGRSNDVVLSVLSKPSLTKVLVSGLTTDHPLVRMRSADALEKVTSIRPELLSAYKSRVLRAAHTSRDKEVRWHLAQMLPRLHLNLAEKRRVLQLLRSYLKDPSSLVRVFAMQALTDIACDSEDSVSSTYGLIKTMTETGSPSMQARGRKLLARLHAHRTALGDASRSTPER